MTQAGAIQVIPGSGGQLGQIIATRALPGSGSQPPTSGSGGAGVAAPRTMPAAVALVPLSNGSAPATPPAQPSRPEPSGPVQANGQTPLPPAPPPQAPPVNSAASVITVIQQLDPRDIAGEQDSTETDTRSPAERQQQDREEIPTNARQPTSNPALLTASEREIVQQLRSRDAAVRTEEESHQTLAGANAGMISYSYTAGPDGRLYATGGKVSIRPLQGLDGMAAIANQAAIARAASVPGSSAADFNVAKGASMNIATMIASQASAAAESYRIALGLNAAPGAIDLRG